MATGEDLLNAVDEVVSDGVRRGLVGEVIRRALSMEKFLADRQAEGAKVLIRERDGTLREV